MDALDRDAIARRYSRVRARTEALAAPMSPEDAMVQSMPDASPTKWHLAHTTWFFEEFVLAPFDATHRWRDERWRVLYNSYYEAVGPRHARSARGLLSRPSLAEVKAWRASVDDRVLSLLATAVDAALEATLLGTHHEEQHQELILTDAIHALWSSPLQPGYAEGQPPEVAHDAASPVTWVSFAPADVRVGHDGPSFAFDNETPRHRVLVEPFTLASRLVSNAEYAAFIEDGGYDRADLWLSDGWSAVQAAGWRAPLYWQRATDRPATPPSSVEPVDSGWWAFGPHGLRALEERAPVCHVSYYEADAFARWAGARLPTEHEWESVAQGRAVEGNFAESDLLAPAPASGRHVPGFAGAWSKPGVSSDGVTQLFGDAWEWTASAYLPYPRFRPLRGVLAEYNGKFMSGQMVLRGGSCLSPRDHLRASYRNYFPPAARWQMTGIRLARDE